VKPHPCIGSARRVMVGERSQLHRRMLEAVQNHGPEVVVVDEIANQQVRAGMEMEGGKLAERVGTPGPGHDGGLQEPGTSGWDWQAPETESTCPTEMPLTRASTDSTTPEHVQDIDSSSTVVPCPSFGSGHAAVRIGAPGRQSPQYCSQAAQAGPLIKHTEVTGRGAQGRRAAV
jgi:hypothetical protein